MIPAMPIILLITTIFQAAPELLKLITKVIEMIMKSKENNNEQKVQEFLTDLDIALRQINVAEHDDERILAAKSLSSVIQRLN